MDIKIIIFSQLFFKVFYVLKSFYNPHNFPYWTMSGVPLSAAHDATA